jgi:hypothetical protein
MPDSFILDQMRTRSSNASNAVEQQMELILNDSVLSPADGTHPEFPTPEEAESTLRLKHRCYCDAAEKCKQLGVFSSRSKRVLLKELLLASIKGCGLAISGFNQCKQIRGDRHGRVSPAEVYRSVFKALLNGFERAKLSDARLGEFNDTQA